MKIRSFLTAIAVFATCAFTPTVTKAQLPTNVATINRMISSTNVSVGLDSMIDANNKTQYKTLPYSSYATTIEAAAVKISGTVSGKCVLMSTVDGTNYLPHFKSIDATRASLDTFFITNVSTAQSHIYPIDALTHRLGYALFWISDGGTQKTAIAGTIQFMR